MFCDKCGNQLNEKTKICSNCGNNMEEFQQQQVPYQPVKQKIKKPFYKKWWIWVIAVFVVLYIIGISTEDTPTTASNKADNTVSASSESSIQAQTSEKDTAAKTSTSEPKPSEATTTPEKDKKSTDVYDLYALAQKNEILPYTIIPKAKEFLISNYSIFPAKSEDQISSLVDKTIEFKHLAKNVSNYGDKLMYLPRLGVVQISEEDIGGGKFFTEINVIDDASNQYYILYIGQLPDIFENDEISLYGLPLDMSSFENTDGGQTITPVIAGSYIKKLEVQN